MANLHEDQARSSVAVAERPAYSTDVVTPSYRLTSKRYQLSAAEARKWQVFLTGLGFVRQKISQFANDPLSSREFTREEGEAMTQEAVAVTDVFMSLSKVFTGCKIDPLTKIATLLTEGEREELYANILNVSEETSAASSDQESPVIPRTAIAVESEGDMKIIKMLLLSFLHDANQPVGGIRMPAQFLSPEKLQRYPQEEALTRMRSKMGAIDKGVARLDALVTERSDRLQTLFTQEEVSVEAVQATFESACRETVKISEDGTPTAINISFSSGMQEGISDLKAMGNAYWMGELVKNIVSNTQKAYQNNGLQAGEVGNLHVMFGVRKTKRGREYLEIIVDDDGVGYPESLRKKKRFADKVGGWNNPLTPSHREGMYLQQCILEAHGGILGISQNSQGGARTLIYLPLSSQE